MRSILIALGGVLGIALFFGAFGYATIKAFDPLGTDVQAIIRTLRLGDSDGRFLLIVDGGPNYFAAGMGIGALSLLAAGFASALVGIVLRWRDRPVAQPWSSRWAEVFLAAFVLQLSSICCAAFVSLLFFAGVGNPFQDFWGSVLAAGFATYLLFSVAALMCWQSLRGRVVADTRLLPL